VSLDTFHKRNFCFSHRTVLLRLHGLWIPLDAIVRMSHTRDESVESHVRRVDGTLAGEQQRIVQEASECTSKERRYHWNLRMLD
jgi:hypothetical protein